MGNLRLLHFAPEPSLENHLDQIAPGGRVTADLVRTDVHIQLNIEQLPFANGTFDAVYCSHVLQDIPRDTLALQEIYRILRDDGWVLVLVPLRGLSTTTLPNAGNSRQTKQDAPNTLRVYGTEIEESFKIAGFWSKRISSADLLSEEQQRYWAVDDERAGGIYLLRKNAKNRS